jgi:hypothetical protein
VGYSLRRSRQDGVVDRREFDKSFATAMQQVPHSSSVVDVHVTPAPSRASRAG